MLLWVFRPKICYDKVRQTEFSLKSWWRTKKKKTFRSCCSFELNIMLTMNCVFRQTWWRMECEIRNFFSTRVYLLCDFSSVLHQKKKKKRIAKQETFRKLPLPPNTKTFLISFKFVICHTSPIFPKSTKTTTAMWATSGDKKRNMTRINCPMDTIKFGAFWLMPWLCKNSK